MRDGLPWSSLRGKADISYFHVLVLNRRMRIRTFGGVGGVSMLPLPDFILNPGNLMNGVFSGIEISLYNAKNAHAHKKEGRALQNNNRSKEGPV